jgi:biotin synthase
VFEIYEEMAKTALTGEAVSRERARWILEGEDVQLLPLLQSAFVPREHHFGRKVQVQVLNNVQNGLCPEDCGYCSQSKDSDAPIRKYAMKSDEEIFAEAERAAEGGAYRYCMALSGRGPNVERARKLAGLVKELKSRYPIEVCLSVGIMGEEQAHLLADAGLDRLNHNLNTSESHYPEICSTHTYQDRIDTLRAARRAGIETCSGLIMGMGETSDDLVDVAFRLRELDTPSIPVNFLIPIEGNPVTEDGSLTPERCLRMLAMMRLVNPAAEIRVAGGREGNLRDLQSLSLYPANSLFVGGYLTTRGDPMAETFAMIEDAGFEVAVVDAKTPIGAEHEPASKGFRIPGRGDELLKPEIIRPDS